MEAARQHPQRLCVSSGMGRAGNSKEVLFGADPLPNTASTRRISCALGSRSVFAACHFTVRSRDMPCLLWPRTGQYTL